MKAIALFDSTDHPLQLDASLRSWLRHCRDAPNVPMKVLYRATNSRQHSLYRQLAREHPNVDFIPRRDFQPFPSDASMRTKLNSNGIDAQVLTRGCDLFRLVRNGTVFVRAFSLESVEERTQTGKKSSAYIELTNRPASNTRGLRSFLPFLNRKVAPTTNGDRLDEWSAAFAAGKRLDLDKLEALSVADRNLPDLPPDALCCPARPGLSVPAVAVIIPCYKQAEYLRQAVESVLAQSFSDWELIIVNDGSPDDTSALARRLVEEHSQHGISLLEQKNSGLASARNAGVKAAAGAYILPLDADDFIAPNLLELMVPVLTDHPEIGIVFSDLRHFGTVEKVVQAPEYDFAALCRNNGLNYCSLYRREAWEGVGGYNSNMFWGREDRDFWIGCGERGFFAKRVPVVLLHYRVKQESMYTNTLLRDRETRARIVLNHPALYPAHEIAEARAIWGSPEMPLAGSAPKTSIIITTYDDPASLDRTLRSVLAQTCQDFEIIVMNDGGIDIEHILRRLPAGQAIKHIRHPATRGSRAARNAGMRLACGKYVAWLDDRTVLPPDHLERVLNFLERTNNRIAYSPACDSQAGVANRPDGSRNNGSCHFNPEEISEGARASVKINDFIYERCLGIAAGDFTENAGAESEWDYCVRLASLARPLAAVASR